MKLKRILFVLSVIFLSRLVVSCCKCPEVITQMKYYYGELTVSNVDNSGEYSNVTDADEILKEAFGIQIKLEIEEEDIYLVPRDLGFSNANAMSCDCIYDEYLPTESIVDISVITLNDFDSELIANSDVSSHFKVYTLNDYVTISDYISSSVDIYYDWLPESNIIRLFLLQPPLLKGEHSFKVLIELSNGDIISAITKPVNLI